MLPVFLIFDILTEFLWSQQSEGSRSLPSRSQEVGSGHLSDSSPAVLVEPPRQKWSGMFPVAAAASDPSGCLPKELSVLSWEPLQLWALPTWALPAWALPWTGIVGLSVCLCPDTRRMVLCSPRFRGQIWTLIFQSLDCLLFLICRVLSLPSRALTSRAAQGALTAHGVAVSIL